MKSFLPFPIKTGALVLLSATMLLSSCGSDDDDSSPAPAPPSNNPTTPQPSDADGVLAAVNVVIPTPVVVPGMPTTMVMGTGVAAFFTSTGGSTYQDAGAITLNSEALTKNPNNTYTHQPSQTNPTGIDFSSGVNWSVAGAGSVPAITKNMPNSMPQIAEFTGNDSIITKSSGHTISINPVSTGDSILFIISSSNNTVVQRTVHRSVSSITFTASELSGLANSNQAILQANVYSISHDTFSGKKIYFVNQSSTTKTGVTIQ